MAPAAAPGHLPRNGVWRVVKGLMAAVGLDPRYAPHPYRMNERDLEVPEFRREVLRVLDPLSFDYRVPGPCLAHPIASVTSDRSV